MNCTLTPKILQGLGKPTRRGIKKCSKCGIYNGTRGVFCKNKQCGVSLKASDNPAYEVDAVKLITGTTRQVYSVRMKDMVSESRGFVQLPLLQSTMEDNSILSNAALCFVDSCQRSFDNSILKCHEETTEAPEIQVCDHINMALKSETVAAPITVNPYIASSLKVPSEVRQKLNLLSVDSGCPLVQRVSKNVMAIKCQVTPKQPLGYLHFTIIRGKYKGYEKYSCDCTEYVFSGTIILQSTVEFNKLTISL